MNIRVRGIKLDTASFYEQGEEVVRVNAKYRDLSKAEKIRILSYLMKWIGDETTSIELMDKEG